MFSVFVVCDIQNNVIGSENSLLVGQPGTTTPLTIYVFNNTIGNI